MLERVFTDSKCNSNCCSECPHRQQWSKSSELTRQAAVKDIICWSGHPALRWGSVRHLHCKVCKPHWPGSAKSIARMHTSTPKYF